jgi:signal transduction histidine kinase
MTEKKIAVLYIDDERHNLYAFRAAFRTDYDIYLAEGGEEARQILAEKTIPIIIADQRMPKETGIEFFESIKESQPYAMRILLTGYTDIQAVISAVNLGNIYRYLQKPWREEEIRQAIESAYEIYDSRIQLISKNTELEKAYSELDKFVYSASHDMRSPLMSILGVVRLAKMEEHSANSLQYFDMIESSVLRLDEFIKNIIGYYKNNRIDLSLETIGLQDMIEGSIAALPESQHSEWKIEIHQSAPLVSDRLKLEIILHNLLSNAIKFKQAGKVAEVSISANVDAHWVDIWIKDNGIGISPEDYEKIFRMFYRATNRNPGSGIGLYVTKDAVVRLNGNISVQSSPQEGSTFHIRFPNRQPS